jgi:PAS domain S-box-containing protein
MLTRHADWRSGRSSSAQIPDLSENPSGGMRVRLGRELVWRFGSRRLCAWGVLLALMGVLSCQPCAAGTQASEKNVLVVFSTFERDHRPLELIESAVRKHVPGQVSFYTAYMDHQRFEDRTYRDRLAENIRGEYEHVRLDVVIAGGIEALELITEYHAKAFSGAPIVFFGLSASELQEIGPASEMTGVTTSPGLRQTIDLALRLDPDTTAIAVIDAAPEFWWRVAHAELRRYRDRVREIDILGPPSPQMLEKVAALAPHTVVLFQLAPASSAEPAVGAFDILNAAARHLPTYSAWRDLCANHGCIGGAYDDWQKDDLRAGDMAGRLLAGEPLQNLPIVDTTNPQVQVDWRELRRWHIPESALPAGSLVLYRKPTFWERDRNYILAGIALIIIQSLAIAGMLWQRARKRKAEAVLRESEERFRVMADTTPALIWMCDPQGKITYLNERWLAFAGPSSGGGYGDTWIAYIHPDDVKSVLDELWKALKQQRSFSKEYRLHRSDGVYRWMFDVASPRLNGDGSFAGFIGSAIDVTDQKIAQQALENVSGQLIEAQEKERTRIARDLHDDICQRLALLSMELEQAKSVSKGRVQATQGLEEIRKHCSEIAGDVQSLSHQLHSSKLDYLGVAAAIRGFSKEFSKQHGVSVEFTERDVPRHLPKDVSLCLFRVAQEALHNAVKYSGVSQFKVELSATGDEVQLVVTDAGAGFDLEEAKETRGLGLVSMQERVHLVHGKFIVESKRGMGTRIVAIVPRVAEDSGSAGDAEAQAGAGAVGMAS